MRTSCIWSGRSRVRALLFIACDPAILSASMTQAFSCSPRLLLPSLFLRLPGQNETPSLRRRSGSARAARVKDLFFCVTPEKSGLKQLCCDPFRRLRRCQSASAMRGFRACGGEKGRQKKPVKPAFLSGRQRRPVKAARPERSQQARGCRSTSDTSE